MRRKAGLNRSEVSPVGQALNRDDFGTFNLTGEGEAREFRNTVYHHCATSAGPQIAATFDTKCSDFVTQNVQQNRIAWRQDLNGRSVHLCRPRLALWRGYHGYVFLAHHGRPCLCLGHSPFDNWGPVASQSSLLFLEFTTEF